MSVVKVACPHCQRVSAIAADKLPNRPVSFECPGCKGKVPVDPAKLRDTEASGGPRGEKAGKIPPPASEPAEELVEVPPGTTFPPGLVAGDNGESLERLAGLLGPFGGSLERLGSLIDLLSMVQEELPPLLFVVISGTAGKPPLRRLEPLVGLAPSKRRRLFVTLVADDVKSLDGGAAFFYNVDLLLNVDELERLPSMLHAALEDHRRLHRPLLAALEAKQGH